MKNKSPTPSAMGLNRCVNIFEKLMISTRPSPPKGNANIIFLDTPDLPYDWGTNKLSARGVFGKYFLQQVSPCPLRKMAVPPSWGVVRYVIFVGTTILFCFQIANVSPTANPLSTQTTSNNQANTIETSPGFGSSKVRLVSLFVSS